jgi:hypothetical protein
MHLLSDKLAGMIESHTELITKRWLSEILSDRTMSSFSDENIDYVKDRVSNVLFNLREWIGYETTKVDIGRRYACEGIEYFKKGIPLCEAVRSFVILKKIIWSFSINECSIDSAYELYQMSEIYERIIIFFDQAIYYISRGYTEEMNNKMKELWKLTDEDTEKIFFHKSFYNKIRCE